MGGEVKRNVLRCSKIVSLHTQVMYISEKSLLHGIHVHVAELVEPL